MSTLSALHVVVVVVAAALAAVLLSAAECCEAFVASPLARTSRRSFLVQQQQQQHGHAHVQKEGFRSPRLRAAADDASSASADPIVFASGCSQKPDLIEALKEATVSAVASLPPDSKTIDLCLVSVSSLYDGGVHPPATVVVPTILQSLADGEWLLKQLVGSSAAGCIGSAPASAPGASCQPTEYEGLPAVSVTFAQIPETQVRAFYVNGADVPDDYGRVPPEEWKRSVGLAGLGGAEGGEGAGDGDGEVPNFFLMPSPAFATELDNLVQGLSVYFPGSQAVGGIASTVSSLSRAKLYFWRNANLGGTPSVAAAVAGNTCWAEGCVGVAFQGDFALKQMTAPGAKPVGGIYQILQGQDSTISVIVLDEAATEALKDEDDIEEQEEEKEDEEALQDMDPRERMQQFYAKARIPKPVLAEANFLMRTLSDDDQAFMRRQLLVGLEQGGNVGRSASELKRLAEGEGHRFTVHQVASGGMKDGSVTLPLGSVDIQPGIRFRFFVRESDFAKKEVEALWLGYKKRILSEQFDESTKLFTPAACVLIPTLDRGNKFFLGKSGYESNAVASMLPGISCITGLLW